MSELVTLITCTGFRPEALALCEKYIARQTYRPLEWIVVNDEANPNLAPKVLNGISVKTFKGPMTWRQGINTQRPSMVEAMSHISKGSYAVAIIEDDEFYRPDYIDMQMYFLKRFDCVGQCRSHYYNIKDRCYKIWPNFNHTSLCETVIKYSKLDLLDRAVNSGQLFFDMALWEIIKNERHLNLLYDHIGIVVGMKGLPGRVGIGGGHHQLEGFAQDPFFEKLRAWIPNKEDHTAYMKLAQGAK